VGKTKPKQSQTNPICFYPAPTLANAVMKAVWRGNLYHYLTEMKKTSAGTGQKIISNETKNAVARISCVY
jgi:hypothetical protein